MEYAVDLHIHSCISPCGDMDMTPNNIVNMAILKGLDIISITDHNTTQNLPAINKVALDNGIMLLPGIEVQTKEEVHMLCYFRSIDSALEFGNLIYSKLPDIKNNNEIFGEQVIMDCKDNIIGEVHKLLLSSSDISISNVIDLSNSFGGVSIPAHIDRSSYSIISNLGFIPPDLDIRTAEISKNMDFDTFKKAFPYTKNLRLIKSSDAHYLWDIFERESFIQVDELTMTNVLNYIKGK